MKNENLKNKIEDMINQAIQSELNYATDYITNDGLHFLEEEAKQLVFNKIEEDNLDDDEMEEFKLWDIEQYLADVIQEHEEKCPKIRMSSL